MALLEQLAVSLLSPLLLQCLWVLMKLLPLPPTLPPKQLALILSSSLRLGPKCVPSALRGSTPSKDKAWPGSTAYFSAKMAGF
jgi:hypothetical protein